MKKTEQEYTANRIREEVRKIAISCECDSPSLRKHLRRAAIAGELKMKPSAKVIEAASNTAMGSTYGGLDLDFDQVFQAPPSYKAAKAEHDAEVAKHQAKNDRIVAAGQMVIDDVFLGKYEDGAVAIKVAVREMSDAAK